MLAVLRRRHAQLRAPHRQRDGARRRSPSRSSAAPRSPDNQRYTTDAPIVIDPNVPPKAEDGSQPPNAIYIGGNYIGRSLNKGTAFTRISPLDTTPADSDRSDRRAAGTDPAERDRHRALHEPVRRGHDDRAREVRDPVPFAQTIYVGPIRAACGRRRTRARPGRGCRPAGALGEHDHRRPRRRQPRLRRVLGLPPGLRRRQRLRDQRRRRDLANISQNMPNGPVEMIEYDAAHTCSSRPPTSASSTTRTATAPGTRSASACPKVPVLDVKLSGDGKYLFVATFGRSNFELPLFTTRRPTAAAARPARCRRRWPDVGPAAFGAFTPGVAKDTGQRPPTSISTAGDATLSVSRPGHMTNGAFTLAEPLRVAFSKASWTAPVSNDPVDDHVQAAHQGATTRCARALLQDPDVHAFHHEPVMEPRPRRLRGVWQDPHPLLPGARRLRPRGRQWQ